MLMGGWLVVVDLFSDLAATARSGCGSGVRPSMLLADEGLASGAQLTSWGTAGLEDLKRLCRGRRALRASNCLLTAGGPLCAHRGPIAPAFSQAGLCAAAYSE
jgi:hypothetical protein